MGTVDEDETSALAEREQGAPGHFLEAGTFVEYHDGIKWRPAILTSSVSFDGEAELTYFYCGAYGAYGTPRCLDNCETPFTWRPRAIGVP